MILRILYVQKLEVGILNNITIKHFLNIFLILIVLLIFFVGVFVLTTGYLPYLHPDSDWQGMFISVYLCLAFSLLWVMLYRTQIQSHEYLHLHLSRRSRNRGEQNQRFS